MPYPGRATPTFSKATQATLSRRRAPDLEPILTGAGTAQLSGRLSPSTVHRPKEYLFLRKNLWIPKKQYRPSRKSGRSPPAQSGRVARVSRSREPRPCLSKGWGRVRIAFLNWGWSLGADRTPFAPVERGWSRGRHPAAIPECRPTRRQPSTHHHDLTQQGSPRKPLQVTHEERCRWTRRRRKSRQSTPKGRVLPRRARKRRRIQEVVRWAALTA